MWSELKEIVISASTSTWQQVMLLKPVDLKIGAALEHDGTSLWAVFALFPWIVLNFYDWRRVQPQMLNSGQEMECLGPLN